MKGLYPIKIARFALALDIAKNPDKNAIYDPIGSGFNIWATPDNHPEGTDWERVTQYMDAGAWTKKCAFVATAWFNWQENLIELDTTPFILMDHLGFSEKIITNRPVEIRWAKEKVRKFFKLMGETCPKIIVPKKDDNHVK